MPSFPIQLKRNGTAAATPSSLLHGEVALNYADGKLFWKDASNVIQSFTFQAYALSSHTHAASAITSGTLDAARLPLATTLAAGAVIVGTGLGVSSGTVSVTYGTSAGTACQGNDSRLSDARTPTSHSHGNITNAGAIGSTANLPIITTTSGVLTTGTFSTTAGTFCEGNDSRLSDTRTPTDGSVTTAKIANDAVTYAKLQNVSATDRLLGRSSAGAGDVEEITCTAAGRALLSGADAAAQRATLSVQPTASPAFTGTVLVGISSALNSSDGVQVAAANNPGVIIARTAAPSNTNSIAGVNATAYDGSAYVAGATINFCAAENWSSTNHGTDIQFRTTPTGSGGSLTETLRLTGAGQLLVTTGSGSSGSYKPGVAVSGDDDTGLQQVGGANTISLVTQGSERVRVDASGNVGIGGAPFYALDVQRTSANAILNVQTTTSGNAQLRIECAGNASSTITQNRTSNNLEITNGSSGSIVFTNNGSERVRIDGSGNVGIGLSPAASTTSKVQAVGDITLYGDSRGFFGNVYFQSGFKYAATGYGWGWVESLGHVDFQRTSSSGTAGNTATLTTAIRITTDSEVLIGTTTDNGAYKLQVNSQIYATNATIATSDARFKTNVEPLNDATAVIAALRPVAFDFIPHAERNFATERQVGLIAQEAQSALAGTDYANSVVAQCGDHLGLAYEKLVPVLIKALQESNARIAALEERLNHA